VSADVQGGYGTSTTFDALAQFLLERNVAYWYQLGDLVQNGGHPGEWMAFFESGRSLFDSLPAMVIRGNHDAYNDDNYHYLRNLFPYLNNANRCYAFNYSYVIHVGLDNSTASAATPWFADRLATTSQKWRFAAWHTNPYSTGGHGGDGLDGMLTTYLPVVEQYGVATVFNGHSHAFEVTHPIAHVGNPPTLDHATMVAYNYALASRSQGTVFYNGAGVNGPTSILMTSPQEFTITGDTAGEYHTVTLASVYADSVVYRETVYAPFAGYQRGDVVFTYKIVDETPVAERSVEGRAVASPCVRHSPATGDIMLGRLAAGTSVRLVDMQGRTCAHWSADGGDLQFTTGALPGATYILSVTGAARTSTMKIVAR